MSAARLPWPANAPAILSTPLKDFGEVLVPAPGEAHEVQLGGRGVQQPGDRVGGLERRDDPVAGRQLAERRDRLLVGDRLVARAAAVAQPGVLGAAARIVEARRDRVGLEDLALAVLEHGAE